MTPCAVSRVSPAQLTSASSLPAPGTLGKLSPRGGSVSEGAQHGISSESAPPSRHQFFIFHEFSEF